MHSHAASHHHQAIRSYLHRAGERLLAVHDCLSEVSWPRDKFLQEGSDLLDKGEESLEWLQQDPDASAKQSDGPTVMMNMVEWCNQEWEREVQRILKMIQYK